MRNFVLSHLYQAYPKFIKYLIAMMGDDELYFCIDYSPALLCLPPLVCCLACAADYQD